MSNRASSRILLALSAVVFCLVFESLCVAQGSDESSNTAIQSPTQARLFDEYEGPLGDCDEKARLDNFAIELQNNTTSTGHIIFYDGATGPAERIKFDRHLRPLDYLLNTRGLDGTRVVAIKGGFRENETTELWIVPENAYLPEPTKTLTINSLTGRTYQFGYSYLQLPYDEPDVAVQTFEEEQVAEEESIEEQISDDDVNGAVVVDDPSGESNEETQDEVVEEAEDDVLSWASVTFVQALRNEKGSRAYIIYYWDETLPDFPKLLNAIEQGSSLLVEKHGLHSNEVVKVYGGYRSYPSLELWVVPQSGALPKATPHERQKGPYLLKE